MYNKIIDLVKNAKKSTLLAAAVFAFGGAVCAYGFLYGNPGEK